MRSAQAWHQDFLGKCGAAGLSPILSLSFEVLASTAQSWQQRAANGDPARTGWVPPSTLLSPAASAAMGWLQSGSGRLCGDDGERRACRPHPRSASRGGGSWPMGGSASMTTLRAALGGSPATINNMRSSLNASQKAVLDAAGTLLGAATSGSD